LLAGPQETSEKGLVTLGNTFCIWWVSVFCKQLHSLQDAFKFMRDSSTPNQVYCSAHIRMLASVTTPFSDNLHRVGYKDSVIQKGMVMWQLYKVSISYESSQNYHYTIGSHHHCI